MNPAVALHQTWESLLRFREPRLAPGGFVQPLSRYRGIQVMRTDAMGHPVIGLGIIQHRRRILSDVSLTHDGVFRIHYYDHDLKNACKDTFLGWAWVAKRRVLFVSLGHQWGNFFALDHTNYMDPRPYFRWEEIERGTPMHLVPDGDDWRIAIHPSGSQRDPQNYARACRMLEREYDLAAQRYLRHAERDKQPGTRKHQEVKERNADKIRQFSLMLDPYKPATRPKEAKYDNMDARTR